MMITSKKLKTVKCQCGVEIPENAIVYHAINTEKYKHLPIEEQLKLTHKHTIPKKKPLL